jgi:NAD(P)-dependent dehydrogenase (short-subunit alcohol dehydrogenase family)
VRVLVNAAATDVPGAVSELTVEAWDRVLSVNLRAVFLLSRLALPDMIQAGQGTIINVSSMAGKRGWANASAYCASKFALTGFTQALGAEIRSHGVRACVVYPGAMATHWGAWSAAERPVFDRGADAVANAEGNTVAAFSRAVRWSRGVGEPEPVCDLSMLRTGRSHDHPPMLMVAGRVARGRPRP